MPHQASEAILRRILSVEEQINRADKTNAPREELKRLESVRQAYVVDLMDILNQETRQVSRRKDDVFTPYDLPRTEKWVEDHRRGNPVTHLAS